MTNKKYVFEILKNILLWTFIPNIFLFLFWKFNTVFIFIPMLTLFFNAIILPVTLILTVKNVNKKYSKNWWYINYLLLVMCVLSSIYINLFNWILCVEKGNEFNAKHAIDKGTWMIINLEIMISLGILGIGLFYDILKSVPEKQK